MAYWSWVLWVSLTHISTTPTEASHFPLYTWYPRIQQGLPSRLANVPCIRRAKKYFVRLIFVPLHTVRKFFHTKIYCTKIIEHENFPNYGMPSAQFAHGLVQNSLFLGRVQACADTVPMLAHSLYTHVNKACSSLRTAQQNAVLLAHALLPARHVHMVCRNEKASVVKGHHIYKSVWMAVISEELHTNWRRTTNTMNTLLQWFWTAIQLATYPVQLLQQCKTSAYETPLYLCGHVECLPCPPHSHIRGYLECMEDLAF